MSSWAPGPDAAFGGVPETFLVGHDIHGIGGVGTASADRVRAAGLRERAFQQMIATVGPGWKYEPTLVSVRGDAVRVATGLALRLRILRILRLLRRGRRSGSPWRRAGSQCR